MFIEKFQKLLNDRSLKSAIHFQALVLELLSLHLEQQGKELVIQSDITSLGADKYDAFAPDGFDGYVGPTLIEIHAYISWGDWAPTLEKLNSIRPIDGHEVNFLIISSNQTDKSALIEKMNDLYSWGSIKSIDIWGPQKLDQIASKFPTEMNSLLDSIFQKTIQKTLTHSSDNWEQKREDNLSNLSKSYDSSQFSLFLGAGVSASAGMPDWENLLNNLFVSLLTNELVNTTPVNHKDIQALVNRVNNLDDPPALLSARYLRRGLSTSDSDDSNFIEAVRKSLYQLRNTKFDIASTLLKSITSLCTPQRTGAKVQSVVTYNFDDLLERQLQDKKLKYKSVTKENDRYFPSDLPIYHVHGYLPQTANETDDIDTSSLVFSEEGYHRIYADPYHWSNLVQLNCLRDNVCLMIGLSMTDPNLRRLLEISSRNRDEPKHFALMKRMSVEQFCKENGSLGSFSNKDAAKDFLNRHHNLNELVLAELGVNIIWYEEYDDIPPMLDRLTE
jgi:NAD-dependent SIR2 family protein deacetylase